MRNETSLLNFFPILICFLLLFLSVPSYSDSKKNAIKMLIMHQIPYGFKDENNEKTGVLYDILYQIIKTSNMNKSINIVPPKRLVAMMQDNKVCTIVANTPDIKIFDLIEPVGFKLTAGILPAIGITLDSYSSLKNKVIAVPLGIIFDKKFHKDTTLTKVRPPHYINAIKMLKRGRVDAVAGALLTLKYIAKKQGMNLTSFNKPLILAQTELYLVCTTDIEKDNRKRLKNAVIELKLNETIKNIFIRYFGV